MRSLSLDLAVAGPGKQGQTRPALKSFAAVVKAPTAASLLMTSYQPAGVTDKRAQLINNWDGFTSKNWGNNRLSLC